ncbi:MAG TPA: ester cyclase [Rhodothermales bacterium]|nr:ester cyclase [Rhodothermales bacterium]
MNETDYASMLIEHPVQAPLLRQFLEAFKSHDASRIAGLHALTYEGLDVSRARRCQGRDAVQAAYEEWFQAFPDTQLAVTEVMTQSDRVAVSWIMEGTHQGLFLDVPPTGQHITACGISILTFDEETITKGLHLWDLAGLLRAMKLLPDLPHKGHRTNQAKLLANFLRHA